MDITKNSNYLPKVSIAVITYNQKNFLKECIESILLQDYTNIEIVISDDASTDGTQELLKKYEYQYPKIFKLVFSNENTGITANSNRAHSACNGKYIAWMGGDDLMLPGKIKKQVDFMEKRPNCVFSYHNVEIFESQSGETIKYFYTGKHSQFPYEGKVDKLIRYGTRSACSIMIRRVLCSQQEFDRRIPVASDWLFWIEACASGGSFYYIPKVLSRYRRHSGNITNIKTDFSEENITLAIIDAKYSHLSRHVKFGRSRLWYTRGVKSILDQNYEEGRNLLYKSLSERLFSWKIVPWWFLSWLLQFHIITEDLNKERAMFVK